MTERPNLDPKWLLSPDDVLDEAEAGTGGDPRSDDDETLGIEAMPSALRLESEWTHLQGLSDHYRHKTYWSWFLMGVLALMVGFQCWLLYKVGIRHWDFTEYEWLLPLLLAQNLAQVVGLAAFAVQALFKRLTSDRA